MQLNKLSVVTVTYNSSKNLDKYLKSLILNSDEINEVIIIENNSPDAVSTRDICRKYSRKISLKFVFNNNVGFGMSCNLGAKMSKSNYVLFLNPDTELTDTSLKILLKDAAKKKADLIGGKSIDYSGNQHLTVVRKPNINIGLFEFSNLGKVFNTTRGHDDFYYLNSKEVVNAVDDVCVDALGGAYLMVKKSSFTKLNGFDEKFFMYLEDVDLSVRASDLGMKVVYCPHSIIKHIGGASSTSKYKIRHQAWYDSRRYYFLKHFNFLSNILIQPLYLAEEYLLKIRALLVEK